MTSSFHLGDAKRVQGLIYNVWKYKPYHETKVYFLKSDLEIKNIFKNPL
jgi:hypothetical protein